MAGDCYQLPEDPPPPKLPPPPEKLLLEELDDEDQPPEEPELQPKEFPVRVANPFANFLPSPVVASRNFASGKPTI